MCSYNAPNFLFPPIELMYLAAVAHKKEGVETEIIDAIAQGMNAEAVSERLKEAKPDLLVFMPGFEIFGEDIEVLDFLKGKLVTTKFIAIGYYPTLFPEEILNKSKVDIIIMDEPEETFSVFCDSLIKNEDIGNINGIAFKRNGNVTINEPRGRIKDLDSLPHPERSLIDNRLYNDLFLGKPFTTILTSRGCPYACTYCVRTYGNRLAFRSAESVVAEIEEIVQRFKIRNIRFLDDTFTVKKERVIKICDLILEKGLKVNWAALSRINTLDGNMLGAMKKAGCKRLYIGIESGSQKILDYYKKSYKVEEIPEKINLVNKAKIEVAGFFMVGAPIETEEDFNETLKLAKKCKLDYCTIFKTVPYPGTAFFNDMKEKIDFSLFPYKNRLKDVEFEKKLTAWEGRFLKEYYLRPKYIASRAKFFIRYPLESMRGGFYLISHLVCSKDKTREDFI